MFWVSRWQIVAMGDVQVRTRLAEIFPLIDTNKDNYIDLTELLVWHDANGAVHCSPLITSPGYGICIKVQRSCEVTS